MEDKPYADGLVIVVRDDLQAEFWLDGRWLGDIELSGLDQFVLLRQYLHDVDDVAVLTASEAADARDLMGEGSHA